jgi:hypothetical protein
MTNTSTMKRIKPAKATPVMTEAESSLEASGVLFTAGVDEGVADGLIYTGVMGGDI